MKIIIVDDYETMSKKCAFIIAGEILQNPNMNLGLATGGTPVGLYNELIKLYTKKIIDFSNIKTFNLDEYYGLSDENNQSYHYFMNQKLFKHINIKDENINILNGLTDDVQKECKTYEEKILKSGGIDIQILGIGSNGHIGFNEPDTYFSSNTHLVDLKQNTIKDNSRFFNSINDVPTKALSMGIKSIMMCKKIILLASGENKADAIQKSIEGNIDPNVPASILQLHKDVTFIIEKNAASKIKKI